MKLDSSCAISFTMSLCTNRLTSPLSLTAHENKTHFTFSARNNKSYYPSRGFKTAKDISRYD